MTSENKSFYVEDDYMGSENSSSFGKLVELSWDSPKHLTNLKGLFQLIETRYLSNCDFPLSPAKLQAQTLNYLQTEPNKNVGHESEQINASEVPSNLNFSFLLLKSLDDIKNCIISLDLMKRILPALCESESTAIVSYYLSKLFDRDRLQFHPELLQRLKDLAPLEKEFISREFCSTLLPKYIKNRDFYNFLLTNSFIFDIIDFGTAREYWSHVPIDLVEQNHDSLINTLNVNNIEFYSYLPKFYHLLDDSSGECDELLTLIKNKDFNIFLLLIFNLFINKINLLR